MAQVMMQLVAVVPHSYIDTRDPYGWHPLHIIANNPDKGGIRAGMIRTLCMAKCEIDPKKNHDMTPLMCAIATAHEAAANELLLQGADILKENGDGSTAYNQAWHKTTMRDWATQAGAEDGNPVTGKGRHFH